MQHAGIGNSSIKNKAAELAKYGRNGDTILAHISPAESALLSMNGKTKNPHTGLDEHFAFMPLLIGAAVGALSNRKNPLKGALLGAAMGGIGQGLSGAFSGAFPETAASLGIGTAETAAAGAAGSAGAGAAAAAPSVASEFASGLGGAPGLTSNLGALQMAPGLAGPAGAATSAASSGIGAGIMDYMKTPGGAITGLGLAGSLLQPKYEAPKDDGEDEDYIPTDFKPRQSAFEDSGYDTNSQGRSGYYYADGGGVGEGYKETDKRRIAAFNKAAEVKGGPLSDEEEENVMSLLRSNKNWSVDDIGNMAPNSGNKNYAKGGGIGKYASGGKTEDVPYKPATDVGTSGEAAFPTADNAHSYGTRGEFNFFPNRVETSTLTDASSTAPGAYAAAKISGLDNTAAYLNDGRIIKFDSPYDYSPYIPIGTTIGNTVNPQLAKKYGKSYGITNTSTYEDLLRGIAPSYFAKGGKSAGIGGGKDDTIPAMLSDGEHVITADEVSDLGDGSNDEGQRRIYAMRKAIRKHKNVGGIGHRPKAKKPSEYLKAAGV